LIFWSRKDVEVKRLNLGSNNLQGEIFGKVILQIK